MRIWHIVLVVTLGWWMSGETCAQSPGWSPVIIARGAYRTQLESTPIAKRPNRPLHVYGNAVRRSYRRGTSSPIRRSGR